MNPERSILRIIPYLLNKYDPEKIGATIDTGVGTDNFYFEVFNDLEYDTFAIEPLPSEVLKKKIEYKNINFIEAALTDQDGQIEIYKGKFNGIECLNTSSVNKDWWGVNGHTESVIVTTICMDSLLKRINNQKITYFKIDTEGSENKIIRQLLTVENKFLPQIIEFEYGGGSKKKRERLVGIKNIFVIC